VISLRGKRQDMQFWPNDNPDEKERPTKRPKGKIQTIDIVIFPVTSFPSHPLYWRRNSIPSLEHCGLQLLLKKQQQQRRKTNGTEGAPGRLR
jgi:hypothetical protein